MGRFFDNGATRARARAWGLWLLFGAAWGGLAFGTSATALWHAPGLWLALGLGSWLILVRRQPPKLPVLNYHSVSMHPEWLQLGDRVSLSPDAFERQLAYLAQRGYRSLSISEAHAMLAGKVLWKPHGKYVALTFDDGYADNWMAAFPLLKQYGMKATLFVSAGFIGEAAGCRPTIASPEDAKPGPHDWSGYLTWPELRCMQASGLIEIQSHGTAHTRVFADAGLQGFVGPGKPNLWMLWNSRPETRTRWWLDLAGDRSQWGRPVFRQAPALAHKVWRPDSHSVARLSAWVAAQGGEFFDRSDWEQRLYAAWRSAEKEQKEQGAWESDAEYERRIEDDIRGARQCLGEKLRARVDFLCWPENAFSPAGEAVARRVGYVATVSNRHASRNAVGEAPERMVRVFIGSNAAGIRCRWLDFAAFVLEIKVFEGWYVLYPLLACMHLSRKAAFAVRRRRKCRKDYLSIWD
jgi:hypothetical protein